MNDSILRRVRDRLSGPATTLISEGCKIVGQISGNGDFLINGEFDGDCDLSGSVMLAEKGYCKGTLKADAIIISGKVDGDNIANGIVESTDSARINGTVTATSIAIAEGAIIEGEMQTTSRNALWNLSRKGRIE